MKNKPKLLIKIKTKKAKSKVILKKKKKAKLKNKLMIPLNRWTIIVCYFGYCFLRL